MNKEEYIIPTQEEIEAQRWETVKEWGGMILVAPFAIAAGCIVVFFGIMIFEKVMEFLLF